VTVADDDELIAEINATREAGTTFIFIPEGVLIALPETLSIPPYANVSITSAGDGATLERVGTGKHVEVAIRAQLILHSLHFLGGLAADGGALAVRGGTLSISSCSFRSCCAAAVVGGRGGAIYAAADAKEAPHVRIIESTFNNCSAGFINTASAEETIIALFARPGETVLISDIIQNIHARGGAISVNGPDAKLILEHTSFTACTATLLGGVIDFDGEYLAQGVGDHLVVLDCDFNGCGLDTSFEGEVRGITMSVFDAQGGAIFVGEGGVSILLRSCNFINCVTWGLGAALYGSNAIAVVADCRFDLCHTIPSKALRQGGAIYFIRGKITLTHSLLHNCTAFDSAGGLQVEEAILQVMYTVFRSCSIDSLVSASPGGGGVRLVNCPTAILSTCEFDRCWASKGGGLMTDGVGTTVVLYSTFKDCVAQSHGGGVSSANFVDLAIADVNFERCVAPSGGFAISIACMLGTSAFDCGTHNLNVHLGTITAPCNASSELRTRYPDWPWVDEELSSPIQVSSDSSLTANKIAARGVVLLSDCGCTLVRDREGNPLELLQCLDSWYDILAASDSITSCASHASCSSVPLCPSMPSGPTIPSCTCEPPSEPLVAEVATAYCLEYDSTTQPYISSCGCADPLRATQVASLEERLLVNVAKTHRASSVYATRALVIQMAGTDLSATWFCGDGCILYEDDKDVAEPASWLQAMQRSGVVTQGPDGPVNTSVQLLFDTSALRARPQPYEAAVQLEVERFIDGEKELQRMVKIPVMLFVGVRDLVVSKSVWTCVSTDSRPTFACDGAATLKGSCSSVAHLQPTLVNYSVGETVFAYFQVCDINSLPCEQLSTYEVAASLTADDGHLSEMPVDLVGDGLYAVSLSLKELHLRTYFLSLNLSSNGVQETAHHTVTVAASDCKPPLFANAERGQCQCEPGSFISVSDNGDPTCAACPEDRTSDGAHDDKSSCDLCLAGYFSPPRDSAHEVECEPCPQNAVCMPGTTLSTLVLDDGTWRASPNSTDIRLCSEGGWSAATCVGGVGPDYCAANHSGPLCRLCKQRNHYFSRSRGQCTECPTGAALVFSCVALLAAITCAVFLLRCNAPFAAVSACINADRIRLVVVLLRALDLRTKFKILISFYQVIVVMPLVYNVSFPHEFYSWFSAVQLVDLEALVERVAVPLKCIGGFKEKLLLLTLGPLLAVCVAATGGALAFLLDVLVEERQKRTTARFTQKPRTTSLALTRRSSVRHSVVHGSFRLATGAAEAVASLRARVVHASLPLALPLCFIFVASSSKVVFEAWACEAFEFDSQTEPPTRKRFLVADLGVECNTAQHAAIVRIAVILLFVWPLGVPLLFFSLLLMCRTAIISMRTTPLSRSIAFLYEEFRSDFFFWEPIDVLRRVALTGLLLVVFPDQEVWRLVTAVLICTFFSCLTLASQPYVVKHNTLVAVASQLCLCVAFLNALMIKLHEEVSAVVEPAQVVAIFGFSDSFILSVVIMLTALIMLVLLIVLMIYAAFSARRGSTVRLRMNKQVPLLRLREGRMYHLFLSHVWASAQDQVAVIKRRLQSMLPSVRVFLDVDDLTDISALEAYVKQSNVVLTFLSRHYFDSRNCLRELREAAFTKPLLRVHESDEARGGQSLEKLRAACPLDIREAVFNGGVGPIVPWHRVYDFQLMSLRMMIHEMLLQDLNYKKIIHRRNASGRSKSGEVNDDDISVYVEDSITERKMVHNGVPMLLFSSANPGASEAAALVSKSTGGAVRVSSDFPIDMGEAVFKILEEMRSTATDDEGFKEAIDECTVASARDALHSTPSAARDPIFNEAEKTPLSTKSVAISFNYHEAVLPPPKKLSKKTSGSKGSKGATMVHWHFLLYLNDNTFVEKPKAKRLEAEIRAAIACGIPVVMIHENDPFKGGCAFSRFFDSTPPALITDGLYSELAIPFHPKPHLLVSMKLLEKALGARPKQGALAARTMPAGRKVVQNTSFKVFPSDKT